MRILFLTDCPCSTASSRVRVGQFLPLFRASGIACAALSYLLPEDPRHRPPRGKARAAFSQVHKVLTLLRAAWLAPHCDLIFVHRVVPPIAFQRLLRSRCRRLAFDFDDAIFTVPTGTHVLPAAQERHVHKLEHILSISSPVIAGNTYLGQYAQRFSARVAVIPSAVDPHEYRPLAHPRDYDRLVVGWCGTGEQHLPHLLLLREVLDEVAREHRLLFRIIGAMGSSRFQEAFGGPRNHALEIVDWVDPQQLPGALGRFDVGVMPLLDDAWTRGKCAYKALLYMACGVPAICSPVGVNREIIQDGVNGLLAADAQEWARKMGLLLASAERRRELGARGRQTVVEGYSLQGCYARLREALLEAA